MTDKHLLKKIGWKFDTPLMRKVTFLDDSGYTIDVRGILLDDYAHIIIEKDMFGYLKITDYTDGHYMGDPSEQLNVEEKQ